MRIKSDKNIMAGEISKSAYIAISMSPIMPKRKLVQNAV